MDWKKFKNKKMIIFIILIVILILFFYPKTQDYTGVLCGCTEWCEECLGINYKGIGEEVCYGIFYDCSITCSECFTTQEIKQMGQRIAITEPKSGAITMINSGTYNISVTELSIYINGTIQTCNWTASVVEPTKYITADCTCTEGHIIKVTGPANYDEDTCL